MKNPLLFLAFCLILTLLSCGSTATKKTTGTKDFAKLGKEKKFQEAHEKPKKIEIKAKGNMLKLSTTDGKDANGYLVKSKTTSNKYLLMVHEWWGLNDYMKREADRLFDELEGKVSVLVLDLYDGNVTDKRDEAGKYMNAVKEERAETIIQAALSFAGKDAAIGTIGWCFGGGWSLRTSIMAGAQGKACVIYYGLPVKTVEELAPLHADILGIFAKKDGWITPEVVNTFVALAKKAGKKIEVHEYNAAHAFANPSSPRYVEKAAQKANALALSFLKEKLLNDH